MSRIIGIRVPMPPDRAATPVSILQTISHAIGAIENEAKEQGRTPIWDRIEIETERDFDDERTLVGDHQRYEFHTLRVAVLATDPKETAE